MHCKTALAQAEVEYEEQRTPSVYVKFPLVGPLPDAPTAPRPSLVIWTTTPWTLPANLAIAVHPDEEYVALEAGGETLIVAAKLADAFAQVARLGSIAAPTLIVHGTEDGKPFESAEYHVGGGMSHSGSSGGGHVIRVPSIGNAGDVTRPGSNSEFQLVDERIVGRSEDG